MNRAILIEDLKTFSTSINDNNEIYLLPGNNSSLQLQDPGE